MKNKLIIIIIIIMAASKLVYANLCSNPKYATCGDSSNANLAGGNTVAGKCQENQCQSNLSNALATIASQGNTLAAELFGPEGLLFFAQKNILSTQRTE